MDFFHEKPGTSMRLMVRVESSVEGMKREMGYVVVVGPSEEEARL